MKSESKCSLLLNQNSESKKFQVIYPYRTIRTLFLSSTFLRHKNNDKHDI